MNARTVSLDFLRIIACFFVILMHSPLPDNGTPGFVLSGLSYLTAPCIGLFFMVSGALLLRNASNKDVEYRPFDTSLFLQKRFSKILIPTLLWGGIGYLLRYCGIDNFENAILWFMFVLAGLYLLTPILSRWLDSASINEEFGYLLLWAVSLCVPFIKLFLLVSIDVHSWVYYFSGYAGYFVLGHFMMRIQSEVADSKSVICPRGRKWLKCLLMIAFLIISVALPLCVLFFHWQVDFYSLFWYLSITVALCCIVWWKVIEWGAGRCSWLHNTRWITDISRLSFGIYLVHIFVMRNILWEMSWMRQMYGPLQIIVCAVLTFLISWGVCWLISKFPFSKYLIGV